jgi:hypothetical protein
MVGWYRPRADGLDGGGDGGNKDPIDVQLLYAQLKVCDDVCLLVFCLFVCSFSLPLNNSSPTYLRRQFFTSWRSCLSDEPLNGGVALKLAHQLVRHHIINR